MSATPTTFKSSAQVHAAFTAWVHESFNDATVSLDAVMDAIKEMESRGAFNLEIQCIVHHDTAQINASWNLLWSKTVRRTSVQLDDIIRDNIVDRARDLEQLCDNDDYLQSDTFRTVLAIDRGTTFPL